MPYFKYTTMDAGGNEVEETVEAEDIKSASDTLRTARKFVTSISEVAGAEEDAESKAYEPSLLDHLSFINVDDLAIFFRQLASLINSGVTLVNSLYVLEEQEKNRKLRKIIGRLRLDIQGGSSLVDALKKNPKVFDSLITGMIDAGEASGTLGMMLDRVATHLEENGQFKTQMITASVYPVILLVIVVIVVAFLVGFVIPKITPLLKLRSQRLPWNTELLITITNWFRDYWMHFFAVILLICAIIFLFYRSLKNLRHWVDKIKIRLPIIGPVLHYSVVVQFARNLSILIGSGVSVMESLRIVRGIISNRAAIRVLETMEDHILKGESLSSPVKAADHIFPPMVASMVAVGEETGSVDVSLGIAADIHEKILQTYIKRMTTMIEPLLIVVLGGIVGFVAWSLIAGILTMYKI